MDGLNHSVITGECSGCVAYREKVARLEEKLEEKMESYQEEVFTLRDENARLETANAAVRDELGRIQAWAEDGPQKVWNHIVIEGCKRMLAALSDTAGGGWLRGLPFSVLVSTWVKAQPEMVAGIREGVKAMKEGRVTPWEDVEKELGLEGWPEAREQAAKAIEAARRHGTFEHGWVVARLDEAADALRRE